jgi:hypothetical protein
MTKRALFLIAMAGVATLTMLSGTRLASSTDQREELLKVREAVWRAWFAGDTPSLERLVPPGTIAISAGEPKWQTQKEVLQSASNFGPQAGS